MPDAIVVENIKCTVIRWMRECAGGCGQIAIILVVTSNLSDIVCIIHWIDSGQISSSHSRHKTAAVNDVWCCCLWPASAAGRCLPPPSKYFFFVSAITIARTRSIILGCSCLLFSIIKSLMASISFAFLLAFFDFSANNNSDRQFFFVCSASNYRHFDPEIIAPAIGPTAFETILALEQFSVCRHTLHMWTAIDSVATGI